MRLLPEPFVAKGEGAQIDSKGVYNYQKMIEVFEIHEKRINGAILVVLVNALVYLGIHITYE